MAMRGNWCRALLPSQNGGELHGSMRWTAGRRQMDFPGGGMSCRAWFGMPDAGEQAARWTPVTGAGGAGPVYLAGRPGRWHYDRFSGEAGGSILPGGGRGQGGRRRSGSGRSGEQEPPGGGGGTNRRSLPAGGALGWEGEAD